MKIYKVGGCVRDHILGRPYSDIDYVVVGATEDQFLTEFPEAKRVGKFFPVFLVDGCEYAFARTEINGGNGHTDFQIKYSPDIDLMDDLNRRDLTINSMAECVETGKIIADTRSFVDLHHRKIRHTSDAFKDDPLRVFRVARLASQLGDFTIASETIGMMRSMQNDLKYLSAERVFKELQKSLSSHSPRIFFEVLREADCLGHWFPEVNALIGVPAGPNKGKHAGEADTFEHSMNVMESVPCQDPVLRFAGLCHDFGKSLSEHPPKHHGHDSEGVPLVSGMCSRLKVPKVYRATAELFCEQHIRMHKLEEMRPGKVVTLIKLVNKKSHKGLFGFLSCSVGDGMSVEQSNDILIRAIPVFATKLPTQHIGKGAVCADILLQEQCKAWKGEARP